MAATIDLNPDEAKKKLTTAFRKAGACVRSTAEALGIHEGTLYRWMHKLKLDKSFADLRIQAVLEGWASDVLVRALGPGQVKAIERKARRKRVAA